MQNLRFRPLFYAMTLIGFAHPVCAQEAEDAVQTEDISVFGQGEVRQVQNITREDLQKAVPGANPTKVLEKLPGVHFQSADPLGANEWSSRLTVRGFTQQYLGYTLDDIPLGDSAYAAHNGLSIGRAIIAENIGRVTLSQGAGALGTPSTSNLGGTVSFHSDDPENTFSARAGLTLGEDNIRRLYARLDTGQFASGGSTKAYVSALRQEGDNWKGGGKSWLNQFTGKLVNISGLNRFNLFLNYSDRRETDYHEISKEMVRRLGWGWDNYYPDWERALNAANGIYTGNVKNWDDAYWTSTTLRTDGLLGGSADLALDGDGNLRLKTGIYGQHSHAEGQWWALLSIPSPSGTPFSALARTYHTERYGLTSDLTWRFDNHEIKTGVWFEQTNHDWKQALYDADHPGDGLSYASRPFATMNRQDFVTKTQQFYLQDTIAFLEGAGKVTLGFKSLHVKSDGETKVGARAEGSVTASKSFLPQLGVNYQLNERNEIFAAYAENMRAFTAGAWGPFMVTQAVFDATDLEPETSKTYEVGYRYNTPGLKASAALFFTEFKDRLQVVAQCIQLSQCPSTLANVGKVESKGFEAALSWSPARHWTWFNALAYNDTRYKSDYTDNGVVQRIRDKRVVDLPRLLFNTEIGYDTGVWFARLGGKFTDKRHYTYSNDASVPSFWVWNLGAGYRQKNALGFSEASVQLNVTNILDKHYFGPLGTNGYVLNDPNGTFPTTEEGAPRQAFLTFNGKF
ncbi:MAG: TonB-dependent receptor [Zoogloeaceae bacterium]|jgi:iron complex outermembrane receptor protein|nr:TonB-dependent receptor [Zoogloeaceae bacterium]